ncbi:HlyD family efflux transporter periplasmic adaptor subunit [Pseudooceanicola sp.]|uniref:HlyD family efflux transporter periplasmic adaptor subunit n=1 Tax=Pseudooceanicola sp. TaxID=1914328 RepID=UPI0035C7737D
MAEGRDTTEPRQDAEVSVLDQALWSRFSEDRDLRDFARVWLALQIRQLGTPERATLVLETAQGMIPVANWPKDSRATPDLANGIEEALDKERDVVSGGRILVKVLTVDGEVMGAAAFEFSTPPKDPGHAFRVLNWGIGWLNAAVRRDLSLSDRLEREKQAAVLDVLGAALDAADTRAASIAAATQLARRLDCAQVAIGFLRRRRVRLEAVSDVADFRMDSLFSEKLAQAMAEATDQEGTVLHPRREGMAYAVTTLHAELARMRATGDLLTVPLFLRDRVIGALHLEKRPGEAFDDLDLMIAEATASALAPMLDEKRRADRSALRIGAASLWRQVKRLLGPGYIGRKLVLITLAVVIAFSAIARGDYRVAAESEVQGLVVRSLVSPFDGNVAEQYVRAGDVIREGEPLARLDERDLQIELLRWRTDLSRFEGEYDRALGERNAAAARIAQAEVEQARAKATLVERQIARSALTAPFDAIVIEGDLSQSIGRAVRRGEELFQIAPLESYRVSMEVDEAQLDDIVIGQTGTLVLSSLPDQSYQVEVTRITPRLDAKDGKNIAMIEGRLLETSPQIRPGMRGIAKVDVEERLLIRVWAQPMIDWIRLAIWRWTP